jgi:HSP20 family protein
MTLLRWASSNGVRNTFQEAERLRNEMNRLWEMVSGTQTRFETERIFLPVSVSKDEEYLYIKVDLTEVETKRLTLSVVDNQLILQGGRKTSEDGKKFNCSRTERDEGLFSRVINLPSWVDTEAVEARTKDGILTIKLAKLEDVKPRTIRVQTGH